MLAETNNKCKVIDISVREPITDVDDFNSLIPKANIAPDKMQEVKELERLRKEKVGMDCLSEDIFNQVLEKCFERGGYTGLRDALYLVTQANWGTRFSDTVIIKRIDFIEEGETIQKFRECCLFSELKTDKPRTMYINEVIKMTVLMLIWNTEFSPTDFLIRAKNYPSFRKVRGKNGKVIRVNGKYQYELDENGNKIPEPLSYKQAYDLLRDTISKGLDIPLKNMSECDEGKLKIATHSLRKLYGNKIEQLFQETYGDKGQAHTDAMEFLNWDFNHTSIKTTSRYCGDFEAIKKELVMKMNIGYDVVKKYYEQAKAKLVMR